VLRECSRGARFNIGRKQQVADLLKTLEVHGDFSLLLVRVVKLPQPLNEVDPGIVLAPHEGPVRDVELELCERRLCQQPPEPV
jgi:hypothetical protein